ncbi:MAG: phage terminase large subunit [Candidatus Bilamarchaeaceae archaeon]
MNEVTLTTFDPYKIPYQAKVLELLRKRWNWDDGFVEILLSGGIGSAKSTLLAHVAVTHCLFNRKALVALCRKALPDLRRTLLQEVLDHISPLQEGKHYVYNRSSNVIWFPPTDSRLGVVTWADRAYKKIRSLKLSGVIIEEGTENDDEDYQAFLELRARLRRRPVIRENFIMVATNPDSPRHWLYRHFYLQSAKNRFVFESTPFDNPFLPPGYIDQIREGLDEIMAKRLIYGQWVESTSNSIYYTFDDSNIDAQIQINSRLPIDISWDFNVGVGKPLSVVVGQYDPTKRTYYVIDSVTIEGISTEQMIQELVGLGYLQTNAFVRIFGDASGRSRSTKSLSTDYDIIQQSLNRLPGIRYEFCVPLTNPAIRDRHNLVNAVIKNSLGVRRLFVHPRAKMLIEGLRLTSLKKGSAYVEDDTRPYQHVTTALGYWICVLEKSTNVKVPYMVER